MNVSRTEGARRRGFHVHGARRQQGTILVIVALLMFGLVVATGMAADAGAMYYQRTRMQVAADAAALAGARGLAHDPSRAISLAEQYAADNGYQLSSADVTFPASSTIHVTVHGPAPLWLGRLLGIATPDIAASANGELQTVSESGGIRPFGVPDQTFEQGREYLLKLTTQSEVCGNFQALAVDGPGAAAYRQDILDGASRAVTTGQDLATEPGNIVGPTDSAINQLVGGDQTPFAQAVAEPASTPRVMTVALLNPQQWANVHGRSAIEVTGFARFYVIDAENGAVDARFIDRVEGSTVAGTTAQYASRLVQ